MNTSLVECFSDSGHMKRHERHSQFVKFSGGLFLLSLCSFSLLSGLPVVFFVYSAKVALSHYILIFSL